jgi:hypothetical protein
MADPIRAADLETDRALIADLLSHNLSPAAGGPRFEWLYLGNPHGRARAWIATEEGTGRGLGVAAAFPRRLFVRGSIRLGYVLGDFCIDEHHRSLGLALRLQRACLAQLVSTSPLLAYDFPSDSMMAIYGRMQIAPAGQTVRWAKPLRANRKIAKFVRTPAVARLLAAPINELLKWKDFASFSTSGWTIEDHRPLCTEEFTHLAQRIGSRYGSCVERSAEYLNWRYLQHPLVRHEILVARHDGEVRGYVVFSHTDEDAKIVDLFGFSDTAMWTALVARVVVLLRNRGVVTLSIPALATSPWTGLLKRLGFHARESSPFVVFAASGSEVGSSQAAPDAWFLTDGDRES